MNVFCPQRQAVIPLTQGEAIRVGKETVARGLDSLCTLQYVLSDTDLHTVDSPGRDPTKCIRRYGIWMGNSGFACNKNAPMPRRSRSDPTRTLIPAQRVLLPSNLGLFLDTR